jgi:hypothetical protein
MDIYEKIEMAQAIWDSIPDKTDVLLCYGV